MATEIVVREGGLSKNRNDRGGITNFGVSLRYARGKGLVMDLNHDGVVDEKDILLVTPPRAIELFVEDFFTAPHFDKLPESVQEQMFDMAVNFGPGGAGIVLQRALNALGYGPLAEDGGVGPKTQTAATLADAADRRGLVNGVVAARIARFNAIAKSDPGQIEFLAGWIKRANSFKV
ncbi:glycoside hydrolase family 108 protein [Magnetospirillum molischianum]|uniref:Uncharacterized protein n=1 Tax=Magnetospirillum molischianum DSM 120 TaxID=1150626 RepID=H8FY69_MAGML|nr:glycosyl hydrolase 108 family protein [Magnetospirillum molischianum]CCG43307.1 conserved hypothetical protein [Magnetospirillum molischianum DSM 120]